MGYIAHHAIVVTSWNEDLIRAAHVVATQAGLRPTGVTPSGTNGFCSFLIPPDGSKEGWEVSAEGDEARADFKDWTRTQRYDDGSSSLEWVEIRYGADDRAAVISDSEWGVDPGGGAMTASRTPEGACAVCGRGGYPRFGAECAEWCERTATWLAVEAEATRYGGVGHGHHRCYPRGCSRPECRDAHLAWRRARYQALAATPRGERAAEGGGRGVGAAAAPVRGGE